MSDTATPRLALPFLQAGQAQKEITHNEALQRLDALVQPVALSATLATPPASPMEGQCWIVASAAVGDWAGRSAQLAQWTGGGWRFAQPSNGWRIWVTDQAEEWFFQSGSWAPASVRDDGFYVAGDRVVAARQPSIAAPSGGSTVDTEARATLAAVLAALRSHGLIAL